MAARVLKERSRNADVNIGRPENRRALFFRRYLLPGQACLVTIRAFM